MTVKTGIYYILNMRLLGKDCLNISKTFPILVQFCHHINVILWQHCHNSKCHAVMIHINEILKPVVTMTIIHHSHNIVVFAYAHNIITL